jgi:hypothetical protein
MIALGLLLLVIAAVVAVVGIFSNLGSSHQLGRTVDLLGYHLHGSTGKLLLVGVIIGAVGMLGLNMLLAGIGRGFKRTLSQRKERKSEVNETKSVVHDRDQLASELEREHAARLRAEQQASVEARRSTVSEPVQSQTVSRDGMDGMDADSVGTRSSADRPGATPRRDQ